MFARVHAPCCSVVVFWRFFRWVHQKFDVLWRHLLKLNDDEYMGKTRTKVSGWKRKLIRWARLNLTFITELPLENNFVV